MSNPSKLLDKSLKIKDKTELRKHLQVCLFRSFFSSIAWRTLTRLVLLCIGQE